MDSKVTTTIMKFEAINNNALISNNGRITLDNNNLLEQSSTDCFSEANAHNSGVHGKTILKEMSDLPILITRLENAVSKLEGLSVQSGGVGGGRGGNGCNQPQVQIEDTHPVVVAYKEILNGPFALFQQLSHQIGAEVEAQVELVKEAFNLQVPIMSLAPRCKAPEQSELVELLKPLADKVQAIQSYREKNRPSKFINHLSTISESIPALFWVSVSPTPGPYVKEMIDAGQFYSNRVLMEYKDKDKTHVDWVKAWIQVLSDLQQYIKQHHTTGISWNPRGGSISAAQSSKPCGGKVPPPPPGPPPPPPPSMAELNALAQQPASSNHAALFQQINQGEEVTKGLRKVTADMMTHKNPNLRFQSATPYKSPAPGGFRAVPGPESFQTATKPPRFELQGKKWMIEHQNGNQNLVVSDAQMNQAVYVYACNDCLIQIKGKVNSITIDNCKKTSLTFENLVSCVEFINCQRIKAQALGKIPTISIDKTDGIEVYLGKESLDVEVVTSKSSEMNILIPKSDGDFSEFPVPEQYKTKWNGKGLVTTVIEQA